MRFEIKTQKLSEMLAKVQKGVGNNKLLPITSFIYLQHEDGKLKITSQDGNNYITAIEKGVAGEEGELIVPADQLIKLVNKTTVDMIKFETKKDHLAVKGNGQYKIPVLEEEYPMYEFDESVNVVEVNSAILKNVFVVNKSSLAVTMDMPQLTGFYLGSKAVTTDGVKMCINDIKLFDKPVLLTQDLASLLTTLTAELVKVQNHDGKLLFTTDNVVIFGAELSGVDEYPDLDGILEFEYPSKCKVSKLALANVLDRLNIFVSPYDDNGVTLTFTKDGIVLADTKGEGIETLGYTGSENFEEFEGTVNINLFASLVHAIQADTVELHYGNETALKLVNDNVIEIICLMNDDE